MNKSHSWLFCNSGQKKKKKKIEIFTTNNNTKKKKLRVFWLRFNIRPEMKINFRPAKLLTKRTPEDLESHSRKQFNE